MHSCTTTKPPSRYKRRAAVHKTIMKVHCMSLDRILNTAKPYPKDQYVDKEQRLRL